MSPPTSHLLLHPRPYRPFHEWRPKHPIDSVAVLNTVVVAYHFPIRLEGLLILQSARRPFVRSVVKRVLHILDPMANRRCDGLPITCHRPFLSSCTPKAPFDLASSYPPHIFHHTSPTTYYLLRLANHTSPTHHPPRLQPVPSPTLALQPKPSPQTSPIASLSAVSTPATSPSPTHSLAHSLPPSYR